MKARDYTSIGVLRGAALLGVILSGLLSIMATTSGSSGDDPPQSFADAGPDANIEHGITALLDGPQNDLTPLLPPGTALRAFFHPPGDIAYVDIEPAAEGLPGGARSELLAVFSIVNSLVLNVPPIERVKLLVAGREVDTLGGHVVLRDPLAADMLLVR